VFHDHIDWRQLLFPVSPGDGAGFESHDEVGVRNPVRTGRCVHDHNRAGPYSDARRGGALVSGGDVNRMVRN